TVIWQPISIPADTDLLHKATQVWIPRGCTWYDWKSDTEALCLQGGQWEIHQALLINTRTGRDKPLQALNTSLKQSRYWHVEALSPDKQWLLFSDKEYFHVVATDGSRMLTLDS